MTRLAIVAVIVAATGCDRVFGLVGTENDTSADAMPGQDASDGDASDGASVEWCLDPANALDAVFCADFDGDPVAALGDFSLPDSGSATGRVEVSFVNALSPPQSARASIVFNGMDQSPDARMVHVIDSTITPTQFDFSVFVELQGSTPTKVFSLTYGTSLAISVSSDGSLVYKTPLLYASPIHVNSFVSNTWNTVHFFYDAAAQKLTLDINGSIGTFDTEPFTSVEAPSITLGPHDPIVSSDGAHEPWALLYDNVLVR